MALSWLEAIRKERKIYDSDFNRTTANPSEWNSWFLWIMFRWWVGLHCRKCRLREIDFWWCFCFRNFNSSPELGQMEIVLHKLPCLLLVPDDISIWFGWILSKKKSLIKRKYDVGIPCRTFWLLCRLEFPPVPDSLTCFVVISTNRSFLQKRFPALHNLNTKQQTFYAFSSSAPLKIKFYNPDEAFTLKQLLLQSWGAIKFVRYWEWRRAGEPSVEIGNIKWLSRKKDEEIVKKKSPGWARNWQSFYQTFPSRS